MSLSEKNFKINFNSQVNQLFPKSKPEKIAVLATSEYEGIFKNGGVGTYYKNLGIRLNQEGWYVIAIIANYESKYQGESHLRELKNIFSTTQSRSLLNLQTVHFSMLEEAEQSINSNRWYDCLSLNCLFFIQAIENYFSDSQIYIEFHEMSGIGSRTLEAKKAKILGENCIVSITLHSGHEWVFEANEKFIVDYASVMWEVYHREQFCFENADLTFYPSHYLTTRIQSYGWKTEQAKNMPYFIPIVPIKTYTHITHKAKILNLPGMTSAQERTFAQDYAKNYYTGKGEIVDLGCWLGSFTVPFAIGLQKNQRVETNRIYIHAYDIFIWEEWMDDCVIGTNLENKYQAGDSFLNAFQQEILPWKDQITVYPGDLNTMNWNPEKTIEFLLVDAMKSWKLCNSIIQKFFPALKENVSLIQHQDYVHYYCSWIHLIMYRFKDYFEPMFYVPNGSVVFKYTKAIPPELLEKTYSFSDFSEAEINQAFDYSLSIVPSEAQANIAAAKVMLYIHSGDLEKAKQELTLIKKTKIYSTQSDFAIVEKKINDLSD